MRGRRAEVKPRRSKKRRERSFAGPCQAGSRYGASPTGIEANGNRKLKEARRSQVSPARPRQVAKEKEDKKERRRRKRKKCKTIKKDGGGVGVKLEGNKPRPRFRRSKGLDTRASSSSDGAVELDEDPFFFFFLDTQGPLSRP